MLCMFSLAWQHYCLCSTCWTSASEQVCRLLMNVCLCACKTSTGCCDRWDPWWDRPPGKFCQGALLKVGEFGWSGWWQEAKPQTWTRSTSTYFWFFFLLFRFFPFWVAWLTRADSLELYSLTGLQVVVRPTSSQWEHLDMTAIRGECGKSRQVKPSICISNRTQWPLLGVSATAFFGLIDFLHCFFLFFRVVAQVETCRNQSHPWFWLFRFFPNRILSCNFRVHRRIDEVLHCFWCPRAYICHSRFSLLTFVQVSLHCQSLQRNAKNRSFRSESQYHKGLYKFHFHSVSVSWDALHWTSDITVSQIWGISQQLAQPQC